MSRPARRPRRRAAQPASGRAPAGGFSRQVRGLLAETFARLGTGHEPVLTIPRAAPPVAPAHLASHHPGSDAERQARQALYERCLAHYRRAVRPDDVDVDDVGAAAANFVSACFVVLHGIPPAAPAALRRLEMQLVAIVRGGPAWSNASAVERQLCFEQLAVLAVLFAASTVKGAAQPDAVAQARKGARTYLQQLLGLDPDALTIGPGGLAVLAEPLAA